MTKQEKIREGMAELLCGYGTDVRVAYAERKGGSARYTRTDEVLSYLHSQGLVIKVDRELPWPCRSCAVSLVGLEAVEPLIKEG